MSLNAIPFTVFPIVLHVRQLVYKLGYELKSNRCSDCGWKMEWTCIVLAEDGVQFIP